MTSRWEPFGPTRRRAETIGSEPAEPAEPAAPPAPAGRGRAQVPAAQAKPRGRAPVPAPPQLGRKPAHALVVITCMDGRIDPLAALGLSLGDAHVLRNAGAVVSDDVLRSLHASHSKVGTRRAVLIGHTDCVAFDGDDAQVKASLLQGVRAIQGSGAVPSSFAVEAHLYDLRTGVLTPVQ